MREARGELTVRGTGEGSPQVGCRSTGADSAHVTLDPALIPTKTG